MLMTTKTHLPMLLKTFVGFHTAERMLFDNGDPRQISKSPFSDNEKKYLQIVSKHMLKDVTALYNGWDKGLGDINVPTSYGEAMKKHDGTSAYTGLSSIYQAIRNNTKRK